MAVIKGNDYLQIAEAYANARNEVLSAKQFLYDAVYLIVLLDEIEPEVDLLSDFWDTYNINLDTLEAPTLLLSAVRSLNNHVLIAGNYATVDAYLASESVTVPQTWADLSAEAGFTISSSYIV